MDDEIAELRSLVKKNLALTEDTNRMVHKMRRAAMWGRLFQIVWWVGVIAVSGAAYYYYLQPYVSSIEHFYSALGMSDPSQPSISQEFQKFFQSFSTKPK
jgi:hypothetical protein